MTKSAAEIRRQIKDSKKKKGGKVDWFSLKEGTVYLRICPPWKKGGDFWKDVLFHGGYKDKVYCRQNDLNEETGKPKSCIICKRVVELKTDRSTRGKKLWSLIRQRNESLWNILVAKIKRRDDGTLKVIKYRDNHAKVWRLSSKWHNLLIEIFADEDLRAKSILGVTHPKYGRLVKAKRTGSGRDDTNYTFLPTDKIMPIAPEKSKRIKLLKTVADLDKLVHASSKEELEAFLAKMEKRARRQALEEKGGKRDRDEEDEDEDDTEDDEDEEETTKKSKKKHSGRDREDEDDDDSEDEEDSEEAEEDDDEDDDMEKKYKKMKKSQKDEDDDDEEEDDE